MRGKLIQISSQLKREREAYIQKLNREFLALSKRHKRQPAPDMLAQLVLGRIALNLALTTAAEKHLTWTGTRFNSQKDRI